MDKWNLLKEGSCIIEQDRELRSLMCVINYNREGDGREYRGTLMCQNEKSSCEKC